MSRDDCKVRADASGPPEWSVKPAEISGETPAYFCRRARNAARISGETPVMVV